MDSRRHRLAAVVALALAAALAPNALARVGFHQPVALPHSRNGTEPSIAISATGVRYPSWQVPGQFAVSLDGIHFTQKGIHPVPDTTASGDVSNAVDRAGAIYNGQICGNVTNELHTCVYRSTNGGRTWHETQIADNNPGASDRPWIAVYSDPKAPHNPNRDTVYLEYHTFTPDDLTYITVSHDGGATFGIPIPLPNTIASANGSACNTYPGGVVVDQSNGDVYAVWNSGNDAFANTSSGCNYSSLGPFTKAWVATSTDGGASWGTHLAWQGRYDPTTHIGDDNDMGFISIAVDRGHQVHVLMSVRQHNDPIEYSVKCPPTSTSCQDTPEVTDLELVTSPDRGAHWTPALHLSRHRGSYFFPYSVAGSAGRVGVDYYVTSSLLPNNPKDVWYVGFSEVVGAVARVAGGQARYIHPPRVAVEEHIDSHPVHRGGICTLGIACVRPTDNRNLADNIALAVTPAGGVEAAWTNDFNPKATTRVDYACQNAGTSLYAGRPLRGCYGQHLVRSTPHRRRRAGHHHHRRRRPTGHGRPSRHARHRRGFTG